MIPPVAELASDVCAVLVKESEMRDNRSGKLYAMCSDSVQTPACIRCVERLIVSGPTGCGRSRFLPPCFLKVRNG